MQADFYILQYGDVSDYWQFTCQLIEKIWLRGHRIYVYCEQKSDAETIDELLWTFRPDSFIPHHLQGEGPEPPPPIQIGFDREPRGFSDVILNLANDVPPFANKFKRIVEIVSNSEQHKETSRTHFREYRRLRYDIKTHKIEAPKHAQA